MEEDFKRIVIQIFNNWTALKLAVEHSAGGPNSKQIALQTVDYLVDYLTKENGIEVEDIEDVLEDIMDQEFNTICEDNSIKEVSTVMLTFLQLLKNNSTEQFQMEYNKLPVGTDWLTTPASVSQVPEENLTSQTEIETNDEPMEEDPGWTQVKTRRKR